MRIAVSLIAGMLIGMSPAPVFAQNIAPQVKYADLANLQVPVVDADITDRPYRVIGTVEAGVRKATIFSKDPSRTKVYRELWERARKLGADAVLNAAYGEARVRGLSWGSRDATGQAVKFLTDAEIAALPKPDAR